MKRTEIIEMIRDHDLSVTREFKIEGPWGHKDLAGLKTDVFIFLPGGEKQIVGEATVWIHKGMKFKVELKEEFKDLDRDQFSFDVPMRFTAIRSENA